MPNSPTNHPPPTTSTISLKGNQAKNRISFIILVLWWSLPNADPYLQNVKYGDRRWLIKFLSFILTYKKSVIEQWFSKFGPQTRSNSTTWKLVRNVSSWAPNQTSCIQLSRWGSATCVVNKTSRRFWCMLKFKNHCCRESSNGWSEKKINKPKSVGWLS